MFHNLKTGDNVTVETAPGIFQADTISGELNGALHLQRCGSEHGFLQSTGEHLDPLNPVAWPRLVQEHVASPDPEAKIWNLWFLGDSRRGGNISLPHWCFNVDELETKSQMEARHAVVMRPNEFEVRADHRTETTEVNAYEERPGVNWLINPPTVPVVTTPDAPDLDECLSIIYDARDALNQALPTRSETLKEAVKLAVTELEKAQATAHSRQSNINARDDLNAITGGDALDLEDAVRDMRALAEERNRLRLEIAEALRILNTELPTPCVLLQDAVDMVLNRADKQTQLIHRLALAENEIEFLREGMDRANDTITDYDDALRGARVALENWCSGSPAPLHITVLRCAVRAAELLDSAKVEMEALRGTNV